jgi:hypothetical protein
MQPITTSATDVFAVIAIALFYLMITGGLPVSIGWILVGMLMAAIAAGFQVWSAAR